MKTKQKQTTKKTSDEITKLKQRVAKLKLARTPFADAGAHVGNMLGFKNAGRGIGSFIGRILGSGDYTTNFGDVSRNSLTASVPSFPQGKGTILTHREYLSDVITSAVAGNFNAVTYPINPGAVVSFPWLSTIAQNFEEYEILGMIYEFKTMSGESVASTNTALGSVILCTQYDPTKPAFADKLQMEQYEFAQSCKPSESVMHAVECKKDITPVKQLYVRGPNAPTTGDLRWTDYGNFTIATVGQPGTSVNVGELWVSYQIRLLKPRLPPGGEASSVMAHISRSSINSPNPLGLIGVFNIGSLPVTVTSTSLSFPVVPTARYQLTLVWSGTAFASVAPTFALTNLSNAFGFNNSTQTVVKTDSTNTVLMQSIIVSTGTNPIGPGVLTFGVGGAYPGSSFLDVFIYQLDSTIIQ